MTQMIEKNQASNPKISLDEQVSKVFANMPDALKIEALHYAQYLLSQSAEKISMKLAEKKTLAGCMKGTFILPLPDDFDEPLTEFAEYM